MHVHFKYSFRLNKFWFRSLLGAFVRCQSRDFVLFVFSLIRQVGVSALLAIIICKAVIVISFVCAVHVGRKQHTIALRHVTSYMQLEKKPSQKNSREEQK